MALEKLDALLSAWRAIEPQQVLRGRIKEADRFQPRNVRLVRFRDRGRLEGASEQHVSDLAAKLAAGHGLEPLLVASISGTLFLIDGHHRLKAYRREGHRTIPVRVMETTEAKALLASKGVNCDGVKLPMHAEQKREAAWQYLALQTDRGRQGLPQGESLRDIGAAFGVSKDTASRMLRKLPDVIPAHYAPDACDAGTGWPQWRYVKGNTFRDVAAEVPEDVRERHKDERRAAALGKIIDRDGIDAFLRSLRLLQREAVTAAADRLAEVAEADDDY